VRKPDVPVSPTIDRSPVDDQLRGKAEAQLKAGTAPATNFGSVEVDALRLLHRLSNNPDYATDALKLLHELQVHQVELDLQNEEIAANERALEADLRRYQTLYDCAPLAYLLVDFEGRIIQGNRAAAVLFDVGLADLEGRPVETFLAPQQRPQLHDLLQRVASSGRRDSCVAMTGACASGHRTVQFLAAMAPGQDYLLLACYASADVA